MIGMEFFMNRLTFQNFIIFDVEDWTTRDGELQNRASERLRWLSRRWPGVSATPDA